MSLVEVLRLTYLFALLLGCGFALRSGGSPERTGAVIFLMGSFISYPAATLLGSDWQSTELGVLTVDVIVLASYTYLALRCDRFWPLWITAFHLVAVITHLAMLTNAEVVPFAYAVAQPFWAYPMLLTLIIGTVAYRKSQSYHSDLVGA